MEIIRRTNVLLLVDESGGMKRQKDKVIANMLNITPIRVYKLVNLLIGEDENSVFKIEAIISQK